jgi:hypothetical protein
MTRAAIMIAAAVWMAAGCAPAPARGYDVLAASPAAGELTPQDIYPLLAGPSRWRITTGDGAGTEFTRSRGRTELHGATWCDQEATRRSEYWHIDSSGNLVMGVDVEHDDNAVNLFEPPMVIAPARLRAGQPWKQEVAMRVMDARNPQRQRDAGTGTRTMRYVEDVVLKTPLGKVAAKRVEIEFEADLRMARALSIATLYVVPGLGSVVEERQDSVRLLKVPIRGSEQVLVLVSAPGALP